MGLISVFLSEVSELNIRAFLREVPHFLQYCHCHESGFILLHLRHIKVGAVLEPKGFSFTLYDDERIRSRSFLEIRNGTKFNPANIPMNIEQGRIKIKYITAKVTTVHQSSSSPVSRYRAYSASISCQAIKTPIDIVNIFRPSKETPILANQAVKIRTKVLWLQYGIQNEEAKKIATEANISYVENRCIKQEYQKIFQKMSPVFPALKL